MSPRTLRYLLIALGLGIVGVLCGMRAAAQSPLFRPVPAVPRYAFSIEGEAGDTLPLFLEEGRTFVLAEAGQRYNVRIGNPTAARVEAVLSVDGRDAVSGRLADYVHERGYVIPAYGSVLVEGFRRSLDEVAAFRFSSAEASYSARRGTPQWVGVVGVAFFPERAPTSAPFAVPLRRRPRPESAPERTGEERGSGAPVQRERDWVGSVNHSGTEFGEACGSRVDSAPFERATASHPAKVVTLRYDDAQGLEARGIDVSAYARFPLEQQAFPGTRFAEPPR